ncbi:Por secretion system C-terminal sorting domain-containing protein [Chryseobacterium oleae]|uniref:Por secretion system C-terminal sorting domain-containing protein n=1 Tax=Chryseobacterium oleae TaxID=491207 RepID=A0A1I4W1G6_CHROL|nr:BspA family leucine-rich repeat surface protein [Chryseobacterium oleae]SFN07361.1 Por secretion system C-terminal sorting domain-containing protein [Chryseobacterium oleae]
MINKTILFVVFIVFFQFIKAQDEFITIWKPSQQLSFPFTIDAPSQPGAHQIWFPGIGEHYNIEWEEINYPQHSGILSDVTSTKQVLIDFGTPLNPNAGDATYRVKVSNGSGTFRQIQFGVDGLYSGSIDKIADIQQWGNIKWQSMNNAFSDCRFLQLSASDSPDLDHVTDASYMFYSVIDFKGNVSMANWNTSKIKNFEFMFGIPPGSFATDTFNAPVGSWNTSSAENFRCLFFGRNSFNQNLNSWNTSNVTNLTAMFGYTKNFNQPLSNWDTSKVITMNLMFQENKIFNQNLNSWNTSKVTDMSFMFSGTDAFNQPLDNWNTALVTNMSFMFHFNPNFNQPLNTWNTSSVTDMSHMFHDCVAFNQPLDAWNTGTVSNLSTVFAGATGFNQSLESWNIPLLTIANSALTNSGIDCTNYSRTLTAWAENPNTANNVNLGSVAPLTYSSDVAGKRNILISKGWIFSDDMVGECRTLSVSDSGTKESGFIYPNPTHDVIFIKNIPDIKSYILLDASGRMAGKNILTGNSVNIQSLEPGIYILQLISKEKIHAFKFIKR